MHFFMEIIMPKEDTMRYEAETFQILMSLVVLCTMYNGVLDTYLDVCMMHDVRFCRMQTIISAYRVHAIP